MQTTKSQYAYSSSRIRAWNAYEYSCHGICIQTAHQLVLYKLQRILPWRKFHKAASDKLTVISESQSDALITQLWVADVLSTQLSMSTNLGKTGGNSSRSVYTHDKKHASVRVVVCWSKMSLTLTITFLDRWHVAMPVAAVMLVARQHNRLSLSMRCWSSVMWPFSIRTICQHSTVFTICKNWHFIPAT